MKNVALKLAGTEREPLDIAVTPGTTPADVFRTLNLPDYKLSFGSEFPILGDDENIYPLVQDGVKLFATTTCELG